MLNTLHKLKIMKTLCDGSIYLTTVIYMRKSQKYARISHVLHVCVDLIKTNGSLYGLTCYVCLVMDVYGIYHKQSQQNITNKYLENIRTSADAYCVKSIII